MHAVAVNPIQQSQFTDHLAPAAIIMGCPLLFNEEEAEKQALHYYPELMTELVPFQGFNPEYLIAHYDLILLSDQFDRKTFRTKFAPLEKKYQKRIRCLHCPHGFSDKGFYLRGVAFEDIAWIYGQNMLDLLKEWGVLSELKQYVLTGNYRLSYYLKHKKFFDELLKKEVLSRFAKKKKILLYAPTCSDNEDSSSFFEAAKHLLEKLPEDYNMIVKLHPRLELDDPAFYYHILGRYEDRKNILFLKDFPLIYPLLAAADIYIGDMSSIGYDFLIFNRPMFFLNQQQRDSSQDRALYLFRTGTEILPSEYSRIYSLIDQAIESDQEKFSQIRKEVYEYTFGKERSFEEIRNETWQQAKILLP